MGYGTYDRQIVDSSGDDHGLDTAKNLTGVEGGTAVLTKTACEPMTVERFGFRPTTVFAYGGVTTLGYLGLYRYPHGLVCVDLPTAVDMYNSLVVAMNAHVADLTMHKAVEVDLFPLSATPVAQGDLTTLMANVNLMQIAYKAHNTDAIAGGPTYHQAQDTTHAPANDTAVTTLATTIAKLNDLLLKYNLHDLEDTAHTLSNLHQAYKVLLASIKLGDGDAVGFEYVCDVDNLPQKAVLPYQGLMYKGVADLVPGDQVVIEQLVETEGGGASGAYQPFIAWRNRAESENDMTRLVNRTPVKAAVQNNVLGG